MRRTHITGREGQDDERRARFYLNRRLSMRRRKAAGQPVDANFGGVGKYHLPSREVSARGVEKKRAAKVGITLHRPNLPEPGDEP